MDPIALSHAQVLEVNAALIARAVDGLSHEELLRHPGEHGNPMLWIAAHVVATRGGLLKMLGGAWDEPAWARDFVRGSARPAGAAYPPVSRVLATLTATGGALAAAIETVDESRWNAPSPRSFPFADTSLRGALAFLVFHETYHVGQLGYLRRWLGHAGLVG
jgi:uncharacterized damage-inducible protein DinB